MMMKMYMRYKAYEEIVETATFVGFYKKKNGPTKEGITERAKQDLNEVSAHAAVLPVSPLLFYPPLSVLFHRPSFTSQLFLSLLVSFELNLRRAPYVCAL